MPCLILTGHPCVGKTTLAELIKERALQHSSKRIESVVIVNESVACPGLTQAQCYASSHAEKKTRAALKAKFDQAVVGGSKHKNKDKNEKKDSKSTTNKMNQLVILDSLNYIKGFRYELWCISKAQGEQHGVIWALNSMNLAREWNRARNETSVAGDDSSTNNNQPPAFYSDQLLDELAQRFEPPDERNRWDKPLYKVDMRPQDIKEKEKSNSSGAEGEILEKSVYNMHALSDVMGATTNDANVINTNEALSTTEAAPKKKTFKGFKRAAKTAKPVAATVISPDLIANNDGASTLPHLGDTETVLYPKDFLYSSQPIEAAIPGSGSSVEQNVSENGDNDNDSDMNDDHHDQNSARYPKAKKTTRKQPPKPDPLATVQEQVDTILDAFLLHVKPLKEGTSTQLTQVAGSANVLHELDAITQRVCDAIVQGQTQGTLVGRIPISLGAGPSLVLDTNRRLPLSEIKRLRRQYLQWVATHPPDDCSTEQAIARSFVTYIQAQL